MLRPLTIGEIFDRSITIYVRNFTQFALIGAVAVVPLSFLLYAATIHQNQTYAQLLAWLQHPERAPKTDAASEVWFFWYVAAAVLLTALAAVASASSVGAIYRGARPQWLTSYGLALRRVLAILGTIALEGLTFLAVVFAGSFLISIVAVTVVAGGTLLHASTPATVAAIALAVIGALAMLAAILDLYLVFAFALNEIGVEDARLGKAVGRGFARIFNRSELGRSLVIALAFFAVLLGIDVVVGGISLLLDLAIPVRIVDVAVKAAIGAVTTPFASVLLAVYYFDVRVRREGLDLQREVESLQTAAAGS